ncbi:MAG: hypothetical protein OXC30_05470 [Alphaproteobacteria bacterium]|nr:hypothetical protein [Alphaproteobacteria bacterium]
MINIIIFSLFIFVFNIDAVSAVLGEGDDWFTHQAVQKNYATLAWNLENCGVTVQNSLMMKSCAVLSEQFHKLSALEQVDIGVALHTLCQESCRRANDLSQIFRTEDTKLSQGQAWIRRAFIRPAFGRCVPVVNCMDLQSALLRFYGVKNSQVDSVKNSQEYISHILYHYEKKTGSDRFVSLAPSARDNIALQSDVCLPLMYDPSKDPRSQSVVMSGIPQKKYQHYTAYMMRGADPHSDPAGKRYMLFAASERKLDISEEIPNILARIFSMMSEVPSAVQVGMQACMENVHARLQHIMKGFCYLSNFDQAMLFAWAFTIERKGKKAFYNLGFFKNPCDSIHFIWQLCIVNLPHYLYALAESTNIEDYGGCMRSEETLRKHEMAKNNLYTEIPAESADSYSPMWRHVTNVHSPLNYSFKSLFQELFPYGDAPGVLMLGPHQ